jgi:hypothetical protein
MFQFVTPEKDNHEVVIELIQRILQLHTIHCRRLHPQVRRWRTPCTKARSEATPTTLPRFRQG